MTLLYERNYYGDKLNVYISNPPSTLSENWINLFTDEAVDRGSGAASVGGVLLDQNRNWIFSFNRFLKKCNIFDVELWGILDSMIMAFSNGFNRVVIYIDNLKVAQTLLDNLLGDSSITILKRVQKVMNTEEHWLIRHVVREDNRVIDYLAKLSLERRKNLQIYDECPHSTSKNLIT
ncbi:hypothetical protein PVK06_037843 [Gossypium arboreum]|uniref:RNase H type-1 domain-containing protein n=1 Tax=Gossypium arboreum TaxID=29729 RepID=A0ABR0MYG7_GOSAR|nr:hypothetical protein PVK06_037843 [Gossypium arboreum]